MKRTELVRRTPLRATSLLRRTAPVAAERAQNLTGRTANPPRLRPVSNSDAQRLMLRRRRAAVVLLREIDPSCAMCGSRGEVHGHERQGRSQGGDPGHPDCLLCPQCNGWCEDNPVTAALWGWKSSRKHPRSTELAENEAFRHDGTVYTFPLYQDLVFTCDNEDD